MKTCVPFISTSVSLYVRHAGISSDHMAFYGYTCFWHLLHAPGIHNVSRHHLNVDYHCVKHNVRKSYTEFWLFWTHGKFITRAMLYLDSVLQLALRRSTSTLFDNHLTHGTYSLLRYLRWTRYRLYLSGGARRSDPTSRREVSARREEGA